MPIPFCHCEACRTARAVGGRNLRRRSALLVDGALLVDLGPDVASASFEHDLSFEGVRWCLQTHAHADHFDPEFLISRHPDWHSMPQTLSLFASGRTLGAIDAEFQRSCTYGSIFDPATQHALRLDIAEVSAFSSVAVGTYTVVPYPANHAQDQDALLYSIDDGHHALFYATDTASISDAVWNDMVRRRARYDVVVLDHTYGIGCRGEDHLCAAEVADLAPYLRRTGILREGGTVLATHMSHEGTLEHEELDRYASARGYRIAYDGLSLELTAD
jgi:phosphoribosyl 1,2-cyclic phosphodiesterase